jgi:hypothetical protein
MCVGGNRDNLSKSYLIRLEQVYFGPSYIYEDTGKIFKSLRYNTKSLFVTESQASGLFSSFQAGYM